MIKSLSAEAGKITNLDNIGEIPHVIDILINIRKIYDISGLIKSLKELGIAVPSSLSRELKSEVTGVGVSGGLVGAKIAIDAFVNHLISQNHWGSNGPLIHSVVDTGWAAATVGINRLSIPSDLINQSVLIVKSYNSVSKISNTVLQTAINNGYSDANFIRIIGEYRASKDPKKEQEAMKLTGILESTLNTDKIIASDLSGSVWPNQVDSGTKVLIIRSIVRAMLLGTPSAISAAKALAEQDDQRVNAGIQAGGDIAQAFVRSHEYTHFANEIAAKFDVQGW